MGIEEIQQEIDALKQIELQNQAKLEALQQELLRLANPQVAPMQANPQVPPMSPVVQANPQVPPMPPTTQVNPQVPPMSPVMQANPQVSPMPAHAGRKPSADMEKLIGKSWMGIMASGLIFISIIIFATLLIPLLTDTLKMIIMYVFSIAFLSVGLVLLQKKNNAAHIAVSACGLGALYISMLLSNIYFHVIDDIVLYLFIFVWAIGVAYLSKAKSLVFLIIGQMGIVVSVILGTVNCVTVNDNMKLFILSLFFLLSEVVYELFNRNQKLLNVSFGTASYAIIAIGAIVQTDTPYLTLFALLAVAVVQIVNCALCKIRCYAVFDIIYALFFVGITALLFSETDIGDYALALTFYAVACLNIAAAHLLYKGKKHGADMIAVSACNACIMAASMVGKDPNFYLLLVPCVLMVLGFALSDNAYKIEGFAALAVLMAASESEVWLLESILELVFLVGVLLAAELFARSSWMKAVVFVFLHISVFKAVATIGKAAFKSGWNDIEWVIAITLLLMINLAFKFLLNRENSKVLLGFTYASSAFLMAVVSSQLCSVSISSVDYYITLVVAAAVFANNTYRFIRSGDTKYQVYGAIKVTAFLILVLATLQKATVLLSVALLVLSVIWILVGFALSAKVIRMYGLVITNISIVKLILVDISYNSSVEKAAGFFACGLLCFAISFIYNMIDKNVDKLPRR